MRRHLDSVDVPEVVADLEDEPEKRSWFPVRELLIQGARAVFIVAGLVFIRAVSVGLDELRTIRTTFVEQATLLRVSIQLQGQGLSRNLHSIDVNSGVLIDRLDTQLTRARGQMKEVASTAAIASKEERKQLTQAIEKNTDAQRDLATTPQVVVPEVTVSVPTPPPTTQTTTELRDFPEGQDIGVVPRNPPAVTPARKPHVWTRLWKSILHR